MTNTLVIKSSIVIFIIMCSSSERGVVASETNSGLSTFSNQIINFSYSEYYAFDGNEQFTEWKFLRKF